MYLILRVIFAWSRAGLLLSAWLVAAQLRAAVPLTPTRSVDTAVFALAIGSNRAPDAQTEPLRYADDDAVQNAMLMQDLGATVLLLVKADAETRALYPDLEAVAPSHAAVRSAWDKLDRKIVQARAAGQRTALYLFYSGHGGVDQAEGYVTLGDGRLWRRQLAQLLRSSSADDIHLVVDACRSYYLVFARGAGGERRSVVPFAVATDVELPARVGVFLSTSSAADSHEWEAFQAGVFSHELRSALRGGADVDGDATVSYQEAAAFIWNANAAIANARYRPRFYARAPHAGQAAKAGASARHDATLVDLKPAIGDRLQLGPGIAHPLYVEDSAGIRLGDVHPAADLSLTLILPTRRPLFLRRHQPTREIVLADRSVTQLESQSWQVPKVLTRGAEHVAFGSLFAQPFGAASVRDYMAEGRYQGLAEATLSQRPDPLFASLGVVGVGSLLLAAAGGSLTVLASQQRLSIDDALSAVAVDNINRRITLLNTEALLCYGAAGLLATGFVAYTLLTRWPEPAAGAETDVDFLPVASQER